MLQLRLSDQQFYCLLSKVWLKLEIWLLILQNLVEKSFCFNLAIAYQIATIFRVRQGCTVQKIAAIDRFSKQNEIFMEIGKNINE